MLSLRCPPVRGDCVFACAHTRRVTVETPSLPPLPPVGRGTRTGKHKGTPRFLCFACRPEIDDLRFVSLLYSVMSQQ